jgi:hypothetical protein
MPRRRLRRGRARAQRRANAALASVPAPFDAVDPAAESFPPQARESTRAVVREAAHVERLAYTRTQAAQALGIGRSTFRSRVLPFIETVETPWGTKLIPADELERLLAEWRRPARPRRTAVRVGRSPSVAPDVVERIREARATGLSLRQIADRLNAEGTPTAHGGKRWWASTVRSVLGS